MARALAALDLSRFDRDLTDQRDSVVRYSRCEPAASNPRISILGNHGIASVKLTLPLETHAEFGIVLG